MDWASRNRQRDRIVPRIRNVIGKNSLDYWLKKFSEADIPAAPVTDLSNWMEDPHFRFRGFGPTTKLDKDEENGMKRYPVDFLTDTEKKTSGEPLLGRDTFDILLEFGLSSNEIHQLERQEII